MAGRVAVMTLLPTAAGLLVWAPGTCQYQDQRQEICNQVNVGATYAGYFEA
jgi:hypothetical protein